MSLELSLLPMIDHDSFSHEVLTVRDWDLMDKIRKLPQLDIPDHFNSYLSREGDLDTHYGRTIETPYGERLTYTQAKHLKSIGLTGATGAYVNALDNDIKIGLFWH